MSKPRDEIGVFYTWRTAILNSDLPPTTRHVLLTLSCHMNEAGESCFPTTKRLAAETGLSERSVCSHLEIAVEKGWVKKKIHGLGGQGWKRHEYQAVTLQKALKEVQYQGTDAGSAPLPKGTEPDDKKALKEVQCSSSSLTIQSKNPLGKISKEISPVEFEPFFRRYPHPDLIKKAFTAIASTRKGGKVADSILLAQLKKWEQYPVDQVEGGIKTYLNKNYAAEGKREEYLHGIIRNQNRKGPSDEERLASLENIFGGHQEA